MKILSVAEFDPAGVLGGHRSALRALGVDYRLAVMDIYPTGREEQPDYQATVHDAEVAAFAEEADIIQFHPAIGQPWSFATDAPHYNDAANTPFNTVDWKDQRFQRARRISYFHGSKNAAKNAQTYAAYWRERGHAIWASTLDYVHWMEAVYAPPIVTLPQTVTPVPWEDSGEGRVHQITWGPTARLRQEDDPLIVAHAPTDPGNCHTRAFMAFCQRKGIVVEFMFNRKHPEVIRRKAECNAGFDHLRGAFSVNTVENCLLGLVPLVGVKREYLVTLEREIGEARSLFLVQTQQDLEQYLVALDDSPELTRRVQLEAQQWARCWDPPTLGKKLLRKYQDVLR